MREALNLEMGFDSLTDAFELAGRDDDIQVEAHDRLCIGIHRQPADDAVIHTASR